MLSTLIRLFRGVPPYFPDQREWMKAIMRQEMDKGRHVVLFYVDIVNRTETQQRYGATSAKRMLPVLAEILPAVARQALEIKGRILTIQQLGGDDFAIYGSFGGQVSDEDCRLLSLHVQEVAERRLHEQVGLGQREDLRVRIGYARMAGRDIAQEMYTSLKQAVHMAKYGLTSEAYTHITRFHTLLAEEHVQMHFMPIIHLPDCRALGWEALARGPQNSPFATPAALFHYAEETDTVFRLEQICRKRALEQLRYLNPGEKLFINLDPRAIDDPYLLRGNVQNMLADYGLHPHNIVFEITERHAITNYPLFRKVIEAYRKKGYMIAVDDAGAGYSSLESITEIDPDFIKLDMSLIRNIDVDPIKQALLETFVSFAEKVRCKIIAEGIETERELETLIELGVVYGQGYYLGKPDRGMAQVSGQAMNVLRSMQEKRREGERQALCTMPDMTEIMAKTICVEKHVRVRQIHDIFKQNQRIESVVVLEEGRPLGLVMRFSLSHILGGPYGIALYYERPVSHIMNTNPLLASRTDRLDEVAKRAMARDPYHLYDVVIIVGAQKEYLGIVSVQTLLDKMASVKLAGAKQGSGLYTSAET
ncbi:EAL domain-containing protein [Brevibacillus sp. SAFN-007a]|uniref:EAL domain-containing protein n=1 Tax=Brevibacillus sp. SAFN-007a TaxID=3436862 RepID=UPI003F7FFD94